MFDSYHKWLGIPSCDQPPHYYRLLSIELYEDDQDVIEAAAYRQTRFVGKRQSGEHADRAASLLKEIADAKRCLSEPSAKSAYDAKLRKELRRRELASTEPAVAMDRSVKTRPARSPKHDTSGRKASGIPQSLLIGGGIGVIAMGIIVTVLFSRTASNILNDKPVNSASPPVVAAVAPATVPKVEETKPSSTEQSTPPPANVAASTRTIELDDVSQMPFDRARAKDEGDWLNLLRERKFDKLDAIADELRRTNAKYRTGNTRLWRLYACLGLGSTRDENLTEAQYQERLTLLEDWIKAHPRTVTARTSLARAWYSYAFFARGGRFAGDTDESNLTRFAQRCQHAATLLDEVEKLSSVHDVGYYRLRINLCKGLSMKPERKLAFEVLENDPLNLEVIYAMTDCLLPRWFGAVGELDDFASDAVRHTKNSDAGDFHYAMVCEFMEEFEWDHCFKKHHMDWPRVKKGFQEYERLFPWAREHLDSYARLAFFANDLETARSVVERIGDSPDTSKWKPQPFAVWKQHLDPDLRTGDHQQLFATFYERVTVLELPGGGTNALIVDEGTALRIHDLSSDKSLFADPLYFVDADSVAFSEPLNSLAMGFDQPGIKVLRLSDGQSVIIPRDKSVKLTQFSGDGKRLAVVDKDQTLSILDSRSGQVLRNFRDEILSSAKVIRFSQNGRWLAVSSDSNQVQVIGRQESQDVRNWAIGTSNLRSLAWSRKGDQLAIGSVDGQLSIFQWPERKLLKTWEAGKSIIEAMEFSPDGKYLAIGLCTNDPTARVTDPLQVMKVAGDESPKVLQGHKMGVRMLRFFSNGNQLVSSSDDWTIRTWDLKDIVQKDTGKATLSIPQHEDPTLIGDRSSDFRSR